MYGIYNQDIFTAYLETILMQYKIFNEFNTMWPALPLSLSLLLLTAIEFSLGASSPYTSTDQTNNKCT